MFRSGGILSKRNQTEDVCIRAVEDNFLNLQRVQHQTPAICEASVRSNPLALQFVKKKTAELCLLAVQKEGKALQFISEPTEEMILVAIKQNAFALEFVKHPTEDHLLTAIRKNPCVLSLFPDANPALFLYAMDFQAEKSNSGRTPSGAYCVRYQVPQTKEVALAAVQKDGFLMKWIQTPLKEDSEIIEAAVINQPYTLQYISQYSLTTEICWIAVRQEKYCIKFVPPALQTMDMVSFCADDEDAYGFADYIALEYLTKTIVARLCAAHAWCIRYIPAEKLSYAVCKQVIVKDGECIQFIPARLMSPRLLWLAIRSKPTVIEFIPDNLKTMSICKYIVETIGKLQYIPIQFRTPSFCEKAVRIDPESIQFVPTPTSKLFKIAVSKKSELFLKLPKYARTPELALLAVQQNGRLLHDKKVPQTEDICIAAIRNNWRAFFHVQTRTPAIDLEAVRSHKPLIAMIPHPTEEMLAL